MHVKRASGSFERVRASGAHEQNSLSAWSRSDRRAERAPSGPVSRILSSRSCPEAAIIPLDPGSPPSSSSRPGDSPRERIRDGRPPSPYLALLRMGFTVPPTLPPGRCALTAPFHPYRPLLRRRRAVCFLWHFPSRRRDRGLPGMPPVWSSDFPPRSLGAITWPARSRKKFISGLLSVPSGGTAIFGSFGSAK